MKVIGITGPTGAGKTTVLEVLRDHGAAVLDCDRIYYELLAGDEALRQELTEAFGDVFLPDGALNREKLGKMVFQDEKSLQKLNTIIYYYMGLEVRRLLVAEKQKGTPLAAVDAINLVESGLGELCAFTLAVTAPETARLQRIMARDGISEEYALARIRAQHEDAYYVRHCHAVLHNDGTPAELKAKAEALLNEIM